MTAPVLVESFGYLHGDPDSADVLLDLRTSLYDPHHDPAMRYLTGADPRVHAHVMGNPRAARIVADALSDVLDRLALGKPVTVWVGCQGGKHRAYVIATVLGGLLGDLGIDARVSHRDVQRPVVQRPAALSC